MSGSRFLYRGNLFRLEEKDFGAKFLLLHPFRKVLVVDKYVKGVPALLLDIRELPKDMLQSEFLMQAQANHQTVAVAYQTHPLAGEEVEPYAVFDLEEKRYAVKRSASSYISLHDAVYRIMFWKGQEPWLKNQGLRNG